MMIEVKVHSDDGKLLTHDVFNPMAPPMTKAGLAVEMASGYLFCGYSIRPDIRNKPQTDDQNFGGISGSMPLKWVDYTDKPADEPIEVGE